MEETGVLLTDYSGHTHQEVTVHLSVVRSSMGKREEDNNRSEPTGRSRLTGTDMPVNIFHHLCGTDLDEVGNSPSLRKTQSPTILNLWEDPEDWFHLH